MVSTDGQILATVDGGGVWQSVYAGSPSAQAVQFIDLQHGWAITPVGLIRTTDGGQHWSTVSEQKLSTVQFVSPDLGWGLAPFAGARGDLVKTIDSGRTWQKGGLTVNSVCYAGGATKGVLWAAGPGEAGVSLLRSTDQGRSFNDMHPPLPQSAFTEPWTATVRCAGTAAYDPGRWGRRTHRLRCLPHDQ